MTVKVSSCAFLSLSEATAFIFQDSTVYSQQNDFHAKEEHPPENTLRLYVLGITHQRPERRDHLQGSQLRRRKGIQKRQPPRRIGDRGARQGRREARRRALQPRAAQVRRPAPRSPQGPSPGTTTTNGTSPPAAAAAARTADGDARPGRQEGGGSPEELAAPAPHWAPLQTCPSGDRNKSGSQGLAGPGRKPSRHQASFPGRTAAGTGWNPVTLRSPGPAAHPNPAPAPQVAKIPGPPVTLEARVFECFLLAGGWAGETGPAPSAGETGPAPSAAAVGQEVWMYLLICSFPAGILVKTK
ncbi:uncharacterized protein LOC110597642 [Ictidomys tridecemlineatus]